MTAEAPWGCPRQRVGGGSGRSKPESNAFAGYLVRRQSQGALHDLRLRAAGCPRRSVHESYGMA